MLHCECVVWPEIGRGWRLSKLLRQAVLLGCRTLFAIAAHSAMLTDGATAALDAVLFDAIVRADIGAFAFFADAALSLVLANATPSAFHAACSPTIVFTDPAALALYTIVLVSVVDANAAGSDRIAQLTCEFEVLVLADAAPTTFFTTPLLLPVLAPRMSLRLL